MARCSYKTQVLDEEWGCPLDALPGEEYCYWHKEEDEKEPTEEQLEELKEKEIRGVYLKETNLEEKNLQKVFLCGANLQEARLFKANLQKAKLTDANLQETKLVAAEFQEADLSSANLQKANMCYAKLWKADLSEAKLQKTDLYRANLPETTLTWTKLQEARLFGANLQGADLVAANLRGANLSHAELQCANLYAARIDSKTDLDNTVFIGANLFHSYFDETKSFRNARVFQNEKDDKEINEITGDCIGGWFIWIFERMPKCMVNIVTKILKKKPYLFSWDNVPGIDSDKLSKYLKKCHGISWVESKEFDKSDDGKTIRIFKDENSSAEITVDEAEENATLKISDGEIHNLTVKKENGKLNIYKKPNRYLHTKPYVLDVRTIEKIEGEESDVATGLQRKGLIRYTADGYKIIFFDRLYECVIKNPENAWHDRSLIRIKELTDMILKDGEIQPEFIYNGSRADIYEASYEVYNNLYNFYIANGRLDQAAHVHYRRGEVHRKLRWVRGGLMNRARSIFDLVILRTLIGYGDRIAYPIIFSGITVAFFALLFGITNGIVKTVDGKHVALCCCDYLYHSFTTFMGIGSSNIQLNLAAGHLPQVLVAAESGLGVLMMALIIFVVTYQVSR